MLAPQAHFSADELEVPDIGGRLFPMRCAGIMTSGKVRHGESEIRKSVRGIPKIAPPVGFAKVSITVSARSASSSRHTGREMTLLVSPFSNVTVTAIGS